MFKIFQTKFISQYYNNPLARHFRINKIKKLINWIYYCLSLSIDVETYIKGCNICLSLKVIKHKPYSNLQTLLVLNYQLKDLLIDFVTRLPISTD